MALIFGTKVARGQHSLHAKNYLLSSAQLGATAFESIPDLLEIQILLVVVWSRFFGRMNSDRKSGFFGTMILSPFQLFSTRPLLFDYSRVPNNRVVRIKRE